jgi:hypothetical protein
VFGRAEFDGHAVLDEDVGSAEHVLAVGYVVGQVMQTPTRRSGFASPYRFWLVDLNRTRDVLER